MNQERFNILRNHVLNIKIGYPNPNYDELYIDGDVEILPTNFLGTESEFNLMYIEFGYRIDNHIDYEYNGVIIRYGDYYHYIDSHHEFTFSELNLSEVHNGIGWKLFLGDRLRFNWNTWNDDESAEFITYDEIERLSNDEFIDLWGNVEYNGYRIMPRRLDYTSLSVANMYQAGNFCDVNIQCIDGTAIAHRLIIAQYSEVFEASLLRWGEARINAPQRIVKAVIDFLYIRDAEILRGLGADIIDVYKIVHMYFPGLVVYVANEITRLPNEQLVRLNELNIYEDAHLIRFKKYI